MRLSSENILRLLAASGALLATLGTFMLMPALQLFNQPPTPPVYLTAVDTVAWNPQPSQEQTTEKAPDIQQPAPVEPPPAPIPQPVPEPSVAAPHTPLPQVPELKLNIDIPSPDFGGASLNIDASLSMLQMDTMSDILQVTETQEVDTVSQDTSEPSAVSTPPPQQVPQTVSLPSHDSELAEKDIVRPSFPKNTTRREGYVDIVFNIRTDGTVSDVTVVRSNLPAKYRREAVSIAKSSTFYPPVRDGKPVPCQASRRILFIIPQYP